MVDPAAVKESEVAEGPGSQKGASVGAAASTPARVVTPSPAGRRLPGPTPTPDFQVEDDAPSWGMVPRRVMLNAKLTNNDRAVYATLATYRNSVTGEAWPKQETLGKALGSERTVRRSVKNLERSGLLVMRREKNKSTGQYGRTIYRLLGYQGTESTIHRPVQATGQRPEVAGGHRPVQAALTTTDQTPTDQTTPQAPPAPAPAVSVREMVDALYNGIAQASGVTKLVNFNGGMAASLFSRAVKAGDDAKLLRGIILRFIHQGRNLTVPSFASQFDALRGEVLMGRQVAARTNGRFAGGGLADSDAHLR